MEQPLLKKTWCIQNFVSFKYNPKTSVDDLSNKKNMLKLLIYVKKTFFLLFNSKTLFYNFYFYNIKLDPIKYRKRKNIYFSANYKNVPNSTVNLIDFFKILVYFVEISHLLRHNYGLDVGILNFEEHAYSWVFTFKNLHYLANFIHNQNFQKTTTILYDFVFDFSNMSNLELKSLDCIFFKDFLFNELCMFLQRK